MKVAIWSAARDSRVEVEFTAEQHAALTEFVRERADDGEWFTPMEVAELLPEPYDEDDDFDTTAIVQAFLPDGFGCEQHGFEDFCVVPVE